MISISLSSTTLARWYTGKPSDFSVFKGGFRELEMRPNRGHDGYRVDPRRSQDLGEIGRQVDAGIDPARAAEGV